MADPSIGVRVSKLLPAGRPHNEIAAEIGMRADAFSRALSGQRGFAAIELARLAELLQTDLRYLVTGENDPFRPIVAARHRFDPETGDRDVPSEKADEQVLADIALAYRQVLEGQFERPGRGIVTDSTRVRHLLGPDFVRPFIDRIEERLGVDVVRVAELGTAYSFWVQHRPVIAIPSTGNWFRENWDLAHELGHLAFGHHENGLSKAERDRREAVVNDFAASLLMPEEDMRATRWEVLDAGQLADAVWNLGVSTHALSLRLRNLNLDQGIVQDWATQPTQRLLRRHWDEEPDEVGNLRVFRDRITDRMTEAATRRFPRWLREAHLDKIAKGTLGKGTVAWMLDVQPDQLQVDEPALPQPVDTNDLAKALGL